MQEDVDLDNRGRILAYISSYPGSHLRKISRDIKIHLSTLRYHLDHLEKDGLIVSQELDNLKIYFVSGKLKPEERALAQLLQQKRFRDIIFVLIDSPGSTFSQLAEKLSMGRSTASKYINILEDRKIISHEKIGRKKRYKINDEKSVIELLKTYKRFVADISFELRTPMSDIVGTTSLLLEEKMTAEQRDLVETIRISADALMAVVNDILDFSKIDREMVDFEIKTFSLRNCIEDALLSVSEKATAKGLDLAYEVDKISPDVIIGDPKKLRQILINLLINAIDSSDNNEVGVSVSSMHIDPLYEIHFEINGTGIGMDLDKMISSTCRELVELMSGKIWTENRTGEGSIVHFTIRTKHVPYISPLSGIQLPFDGKRILIMAGNEKIRNNLKDQAEVWGMIPIICEEGEEALELIKTVNSLEVALLDVSMQIDDGLLLEKEMHRINKALPLIALTFAGQRIKSDLYVGYLAKPVRQIDLFNALKAALASQSAETSVGVSSAGGSGHRALHVLLAEDNESNQKVILSMLKRLGHRAQAVSNGREALQALERASYDVLLMDVRMPDIDGLEATRMIRQRCHEKIKIIALTAYALEGDKERCLEAGMDDYISKPVKMEELNERLKIYEA